MYIAGLMDVVSHAAKVSEYGGSRERLTFPAGEEIQVLRACVQYTLQLQLAQLPIVDNVIRDAVIQGIACSGEFDCTAQSSLRC